MLVLMLQVLYLGVVVNVTVGVVDDVVLDPVGVVVNVIYSKTGFLVQIKFITED